MVKTLRAPLRCGDEPFNPIIILCKIAKTTALFKKKVIAFSVRMLPTQKKPHAPHHPFLDTGQRKASIFSGNVLSVGSSHHSHTHIHFVTVGSLFGLFAHLLAPHGNSNSCPPFHKVLAVALIA